MKKTIFFILLFIIPVFIYCQKKTFSKEEAIEDINFIKDIFYKTYPISLSYNDSINFEKRFDKIINEVENNEKIYENHLFLLFNELNKTIKEGHSSISKKLTLIKVFSKNKLYFNFYIKNNNIYINKILTKKSKLKVNDKIISINNISSDSIIKNIINYSAIENDSLLYNKLLSNTDILDKIFFFSKKYNIVVERNNQVIKERKKGINLIRYGIRSNTWIEDSLSQFYPFKYNIYKSFIPILSYNLTSINKDINSLNASKMSFWKNVEYSSALLNINHFKGKSDAYIKVFFYEMFQIVRRDSLQNLVIDIRNNPGGSRFIIEGLLKYIYVGNFKYLGGAIVKKKYLKNSILNLLSSERKVDTTNISSIYIPNTFDSISKLLNMNFYLDTINIKSIYTFKNIYILINKNIYSHSIIFTNSFRYNFNNVSVIGEIPYTTKCFSSATMGNYMNNEQFYTPNSKYTINIPRCYNIPPDLNCNNKLIPDIILDEYEIDNYILEKIKNENIKIQ